MIASLREFLLDLVIAGILLAFVRQGILRLLLRATDRHKGGDGNE